MIETYEFRVREKYAAKLFEPGEGQKLGWTKEFGDKFVTVRKVKLTTADPKFERIGELNGLFRKGGNDFFFAGWDVERTYNANDIANAQLFLLCKIFTFEPAGEECGTRYDDALGCAVCKSGGSQVSPLYLDWKRIPKSKDIARTIANEIVVSRRWVEICEQHSISGARFVPVRSSRDMSADSTDRFQLIVESCDSEVVLPTRMGINPFDDDAKGEYRCPNGDLIGLARLSELSIRRATYNGSDIVATLQFAGTRRGLLRPERFILASPKLRQVIIDNKLTGCEFEVVHML